MASVLGHRVEFDGLASCDRQNRLLVRVGQPVDLEAVGLCIEEKYAAAVHVERVGRRSLMSVFALGGESDACPAGGRQRVSLRGEAEQGHGSQHERKNRA